MSWGSRIVGFFTRSSAKAAPGAAKNVGKVTKMVFDPAYGTVVKASDTVTRAGGAFINNTVNVMAPLAGTVANAARTGWKTITKFIGASAVAGTFAGVTLTVMTWWSGISESISNTLGIPESAATGIMLVVVIGLTAGVLYVLFKMFGRR
jgi:hypothetical protein